MLLALTACANTDGRATPAYAEEELPDSAELAQLAAEKARADSIAEWKARFGNRVPRPDSVRALYVNGWAAGSRSRMDELIRMAEETEINALVIDIKESDTYLVYDSTAVPLAKEIGADERPGSKWLPELVEELQDRGIYTIARIVVFKDRMLAEQRPQLAIRHVNGGVWKDQKGKPWVNPYNREIWDYNIAIAREALDMGFGEVQWDYVRFPDVPSSLQRTMSFPGADGVSREDNIRNFLRYSKEQLAEYQVPIAADVFGLSTHLESDVGIGQQWEKVIEAADVVLPMVYPSHYYAGMYGFQRPNAHPYEIIRVSMQDAVERTRYLEQEGKKVGEIMPWLEAQTATWVQAHRSLWSRRAPPADPGGVRLRAEELGALEPRLQVRELPRRLPSRRRFTLADRTERVAAVGVGGTPEPVEQGHPESRSRRTCRPCRRRLVAAGERDAGAGGEDGGETRGDHRAP